MPMTRDDFLAHVRNRAANIADPNLNPAGPWRHVTDTEAEELEADADWLQATSVHFADQVDRENLSRTLMPLDYPEAVLVEGTAGLTVVHRDTYAADPVTIEARAGEIDAVIRGTSLLGWS